MKVSSCDHFNTPWIKVFNLFTTKKLDSVKRRSLPSWDGNKNKRQPIHPGNSSSSLSVFGGSSQKARNLSQSHPNVSRINKLAHDLLGIKHLLTWKPPLLTPKHATPRWWLDHMPPKWRTSSTLCKDLWIQHMKSYQQHVIVKHWTSMTPIQPILSVHTSSFMLILLPQNSVLGGG